MVRHLPKATDGKEISQGGCVTLKEEPGDFPGGTMIKNLPANAGDTGLSPGLGRSHMPRSN